MISALTAYCSPGFFKDGATIIVNGSSLFFGLCVGGFLAIYGRVLYWKVAQK